jgi:two-component system, NarL family, sensor kinase
MSKPMPKLTAMHGTLDSMVNPEERDQEILGMLEEERRRIAADLHDGIGQTLSAMQLAVGGLRQRLGDRFTEVEDAIFDYLTERISDAMDDVRRICMKECPAQLDDQGVINAINGLCRELCQGLHHLDVSLTVRAYESDIPLPVKVAAFRILQEACSNACKHARAAHLSVLLEADAEGIRLTVADDGVGFTAGPVRQSQSGFGLGSMRRRATMTGGSLSVRSQPGQGTQIVAAWQVEEAAVTASIGRTAA